MKGISLTNYVRQVRQELKKISWADRKSSLTTTGIVFVFVSIMSLFLLLVDFSFSSLVSFLLGLGG